MWAKRAYTIHCYFTQTGTEKKFQLSVFKNIKADVYGIETGDIDFHNCPDQVNYRITVYVNDKGWPVLKEAIPVG